MTVDKTLPPERAFSPRFSVEQVEEGAVLAPKFDSEGLIPVITTDAAQRRGADARLHER